MTTTFIPKKPLLLEFTESVQRLQDKLDKVGVAYTTELYPLPKSSYHFLTRLLQPEKRYDSVLYSHIFKTVYQTERMSAGAGYIGILSSIKFIQELMKREDLVSSNECRGVEAYQVESTSTLNLIQSNTTRATPELLRSTIDGVCEDPTLSLAVWEAVQLAGVEGNIHVEDSQQAGYGVELRHGYSFPTSTQKMFLSSLGSWESYNVKVLCIDGIIEKVSELDKILRKSSETKIPLVLIAQGFSEEIIATIKTNNLRNVFNIVPVRLEQSLQNLNVLNDIATVSGTDVTSTLKGDMLIYVDYDTLPVVEHVKVTEAEIVIRNSITRNDVARQIRSLIEKRNEQRGAAMVDIGELLDKRIANLLSHSVILRLPNFSKSQRESTKTKVDIALRAVRTILTYGVVNKDRMIEEFKSSPTPTHELGSVIKDVALYVLGLQTTTVIPALSLYAGLFFSGQTMLALMSSAGLVLVDKNE